LGPILSLIGLLAQFTPLVLFFVFFKRINKIVELRVVFFYVLVSLLINILFSFFQNHAPLILSLSAIIEYAFFSAFFYYCIRSHSFRRVALVISLITMGIEFYLLYLHKPNFDFWVTLTTAILILVYCIYFFYEEINKPRTLIIYQSYNFWVATGCIIYLAGTLFLFLYTSDLKDKQRSSLWFIDIVFEIVKNVFFSIAFIIGKKGEQNLAIGPFDDTNMDEKPF